MQDWTVSNLYALEWSLFAIADRDAIFDYIENGAPRAAAMMDSQIGKSIAMLAQFPEMGRIGRIRGTRELVIPGTPYIAAYRIRHRVVLILRILHGAQIWPDAMPGEPSYPG